MSHCISPSSWNARKLKTVAGNVCLAVVLFECMGELDAQVELLLVLLQTLLLHRKTPTSGEIMPSESRIHLIKLRANRRVKWAKTSPLGRHDDDAIMWWNGLHFDRLSCQEDESIMWHEPGQETSPWGWISKIWVGEPESHDSSQKTVKSCSFFLCQQHRR